MKATILKYDAVLSKEELVSKLQQDLPQYIVKKGFGKKRFQIRKAKFTYCSVGIVVNSKANTIHLQSMQDMGFFLWFVTTGILAFVIMSKKRKAFAENMKAEIQACLDKYHSAQTES